MPNIFITLRKKIILPVRWFFAKKKKAISIDTTLFPTREELVAIEAVLRNKRMIYLRRNDKINAAKVNGIEEFIAALIKNTGKDYLNSL